MTGKFNSKDLIVGMEQINSEKGLDFPGTCRPQIVFFLPELFLLEAIGGPELRTI